MRNYAVTIQTDFSLMNLDLIHDYLSNQSYWAKGRSKADVEKSMRNSLCFGAFTNENGQIGFARVATDYVVFGWIMDVFVVPGFQGQGVGKQLMEAIVQHPSITKINGLGLRTNDAHTLYQKFGFGPIPDVNTWMFKSMQS
ncbi:MAG: GNAT family N-acetyltransferase [Bacteroidota bacterium]